MRDALHDFTVTRTEATGLGEHLGPDEGRTAPHIPTLVSKDDPWFAEHPDWWIDPPSREIDASMILHAYGNVYPIEALALLLAVNGSTAKHLAQAA